MICITCFYVHPADFAYDLVPYLAEQTSTRLSVSLTSGLVAGVCAAIVSQPGGVHGICFPASSVLVFSAGFKRVDDILQGGVALLIAVSNCYRRVARCCYLSPRERYTVVIFRLNARTPLSSL